MFSQAGLVAARFFFAFRNIAAHRINIKLKNMLLSVHPFTFAILLIKFSQLDGEHYSFRYSLVFTLPFTL